MDETITLTKEDAARILTGISVADHLGDVLRSIEPLAEKVGVPADRFEDQEGLYWELAKLGLIPED